MIECIALTDAYLRDTAEGEKRIFPDPWSLDALKAHILLPYGKNLVALWDGKFCGYLLGSCLCGEGEILRVAVISDYRRRGVGEALVARFLRDLKEEDGEHVFLEVRSKNQTARGLYEKLGFAEIGLRRGYYKEPGDDAVLYQYRIEG